MAFFLLLKKSKLFRIFVLNQTFGKTVNSVLPPGGPSLPVLCAGSPTAGAAVWHRGAHCPLCPGGAGGSLLLDCTYVHWPTVELLYCCITVLLYYCTALVLYWCTGVLGYWYTGVQYSCVLEYWFTGLLVYWCTAVLLYVLVNW